MVLGALVGPALSAAGPLLGLGGATAAGAAGAIAAPTPAGSATTGPVNVTVSYNNVGNPEINVSADGDASGTGTGTGTGGAATSTAAAAALSTSEAKSATATSSPPTVAAAGPTSTATATESTRPSPPPHLPSATATGTDPTIALITESDFKDFSSQFLIPLIQQVNTLRNQVNTLQDEVKTLNEKALALESRSNRAITYRPKLSDHSDWSQTITTSPTMLISESVNFTGPVMITYTAHVHGPTNIFLLLDDEACDAHTARAFNLTTNSAWIPLTATAIITGVNGIHQVRVKAQLRVESTEPKGEVDGGFLSVLHL